MRSIAINNIQELRSEIQRLSILGEEQQKALGQRFSSPAAIFAAALTLFPKSAAARSVSDHWLFHQDFFSMISRFLIPLMLNKTIFRSSGFLVKLFVGLVSQKAAGYVTESTVEKVFATGKAWMDRILVKKESGLAHPPLHLVKKPEYPF
jgi:hypothetical protein